VFKFEREWSCPEHDYPDVCDECGRGCETCLTGEWVPTVDEDGWWTMTFRPLTALEAMIIPAVAENLKRQTLLLDRVFGGKT
jgi:hypothetical protein